MKLDLVIYGATGFTGSLAVSYVNSQYAGKGLKWGIGGRSRSKLEVLASKCSDKPEVLVADGEDQAALEAMCAKTKVVATCAGPFSRYGRQLVAACVATGTDYCDITGEMAFVREMIAQHDDAARKSGARIVHLCGHDSVPWDLSTLMLAKKLRESGEGEGGGEALKRVDMYTDIRSAPSGGTLETALGILFGQESKEKKSPAVKALGFDPLMKLRSPAKGAGGGGGGGSDFKTSARNVAALSMASSAARAHPLTREKPHRTYFVMSGVNANAVKRSNALNGYGPNLTYCEGRCFASYFSALLSVSTLAFYGLLLYIPPLRFLMRKFVLPKPGQGPSPEFMETGYLTVTGVATGVSGGRASSVMKFKVDPGYKDTARMVVESALTLSLDGVKLADPSGGVFTPAACQGEALLDRLCDTGTEFAVTPKNF